MDMKTILYSILLGFAATGLTFAQDEAAGGGAPAKPSKAHLVLDTFTFSGGTLESFAQLLKQDVAQEGVAEFNIIVVEDARAYTVPPMRVRKASAKVLLETAALLSGAEINIIEPDGDDSGSASIYILEKGQPAPGSTLYGVRRSTTVRSGPKSPFGSTGGGAAKPSAKDPFGGDPWGGSKTGTAKSGAGTSSASGGGDLAPVYNSLTNVTTGSPKPRRIVIPMFYGFMFADKKSDEAEAESQKSLDMVGALARKYFPDSDTKLAAHESTKTVVVQSNSQEAVDFVKAWLAAQQEAASFKVKRDLYKQGVLGYDELLEKK